MNFQREKIFQAICNLERSIIKERHEAELSITDFCGYKKNNTPPSLSEFRPYGKEYIDFPADTHCWFHYECDIPVKGEDEKCYFKMTTGREGEWDGSNPQCSVFVNGTSCNQAFDTNHTEIYLTPGHKDIYVYFYSGKEPLSLRIRGAVIVKSVSVEKLWFHMNVAYETANYVPERSFDHIEAINVLDRTCNELDFRYIHSKDFYAGIERATKLFEEEYFGKLCGKPKNEEISVIGHTHIDVAWLWTLAQTAEKAQRSFSTVINLMEQYPEYLFMSSQPQLYAYVKENDPELYAKIKEKIAEGRWEAEGSMWLEADTNLTSGESLIRQIMYGKRFMKEEFGVENKILWLPDVFGYSAALPQILKKCGVDSFFTIKINWNESNKFPHDTFMWRGLDGSEVLAIFATNYVNILAPRDINALLDYHIDRKFTPTVLGTVGFGDGGGGVTFEMLENYDRLKHGLPGFPKVIMRRPTETIAKIRSEFEESTKALRFVPKWSGELYLELHRGTYTTMAANKKGNRQSEFLLQKAEGASSIAHLLTGLSYPKSTLDESWTTVLRNQFHDILPGSSIKEVYEDSAKEYALVAANGNAIFDSALSAIASGINADGGILVYNPTSFAIDNEVIKVDGKDAMVESVPAHGYAVVFPAVAENSVLVGDRCIENDKIKVLFDKAYHIISIIDKENGRELIESGESAKLEVFEDYPKSYDGWEISEYYKQKKWIIDDVSSVNIVQGDLSGGFKIVRKYQTSTITQSIILTTGSARVDFETEVDWHEDHVLLKAMFPLNIHTEVVTSEIQFGNIQRPTHKNTSWDEAKFEICCHKWADLSESDYGISLLNNCKYGYSVEENKLSISLLKASTYPNPVADRGIHHFTYSIFPHKGADLMATVKEGYRLNNPVMACFMGESEGNLPAVFGFASTDAKSAVIDTVKMAEDGNGYIVRLYEAQNLREDANVFFGFDVKEVYECDCLENNISKVETDGRSAKISMGNFEIKTLRVIAK